MDISRYGIDRLDTGQVLVRTGIPEMVFERVAKGDYLFAEADFLPGRSAGISLYFKSQIAGLIDQMAPLPATFPPAFIGGIRPKNQKQTEKAVDSWSTTQVTAKA